CVSEVIARQAALLAIEQPCSYLTAGVRHPAERERIEVHASEVPRRPIVHGIADRTESVVGLDRYLTQRRGAEGEGRGGEVSPLRGATVEVGGCVLERATDPFQGNQAVRELVLYGLKASDWLAKLAALLGIVNDELESSTRGAMRAG